MPHAASEFPRQVVPTRERCSALTVSTAGKGVFYEDQFGGNLVFMEAQILNAIRQKLGDAISAPFPNAIRRDADGVSINGKVRAVVGMRRSGKTTFLWQCLADRLATGIARERLVYFNFEDERVAGLEAASLGVVLDEYYRSFPEFRRNERVVWCFDEIQEITGWEKFIRRILDSENVEILLSGSSAKMLSREVATSMRGRAIETVITPFSFREFARFEGLEMSARKRLLSPADESQWQACFDRYVQRGGFPEACRADLRDHRIELLIGYVDSVLFRDVAERHRVPNLVALRAFVRQLLKQPATTFSVSKIYSDFQSRGIGVSKETLLSFLDYLEDAFLIFTLPLASHSERRRQVNPRKLYLADHSLAGAFTVQAGQDRGHFLENIVACELQRRCSELAYVKTVNGYEVDFLATGSDGSQHLIQVASQVSESSVLDRELRALADAAEEFSTAQQWLLIDDRLPRGAEIPASVTVLPLRQWLLDSKWPGST